MQSNVDYSTRDLMSRVNKLGNHHQKYTVSIKKHYDTLVSLLDEHRLIDRVQLLRFSSEPGQNMNRIASLIDDEEKTLEMLGCYYSLQFLLMNLKAIDVLKLEISTKKTDSYDILKNFLAWTGNDFRALSKSYMEHLLKVYLPEDHPDFNIFCVGTRVDQEDIDIGVLDRGKLGREILTKTFAKLNSEMMKHASALHFHMSEHVGGKGYSASIEEFHELLDDNIGNFVLLNEMLNSVPIIGNQNLFDEFESNIIRRYYYREDKNNKYHEGYLRGMLGEIQDLITRESEEELLNPKKDGLRLIKGIILILRTWKNIDEVTYLGVLKHLINNDVANREHYYRLYKGLTFLETFRFLYQLFVVQEEEISLETSHIFNHLEKVAQTMGFSDTSYADASTKLLIHYNDHINITKFGARELVKNISGHLSNITVFQLDKIFDQTKKSTSLKNQPNLAEKFLSTTEFFSTARYWDDLLSQLSENKELLKRFLDDFNKAEQSIVTRFIDWVKRSPYTFINLITIIKNNFQHYLRSGNIHQLLEEFLNRIQPTLEDVGNLGQLLEFYPKKMYNFLSILPEHLLEKLIEVLEAPIMDPEVNKIRKQLLDLCELNYSSSYYFKRFIYRVFNTYNSYLIDFNNPRKFREISEGILKNIENFKSIDEQIQKLGTYYDFEFMRLGINAINGTVFGKVNHEFTIFSDNYLQILFELCRKKIKREYDSPPITKDKLAIYVTGGHARRQAFDDDYDLIILLNSENEKQKKFANDIIVEMNKHIIKRSIMPHYKFADIFNSFVTTFQQLKNYFEHSDQIDFINKSQLLSARLVVGSEHFHNNFISEIISPYIFKQKDSFISSILEEITSRNEYHSNKDYINIKESPGGLRDVENFLFILKAHFEITSPVSPELFGKLSDEIPDKESNFDQLFSDYYFLKLTRDLYHLIISDEDFLRGKYLENILSPLVKSSQRKIEDKKELEEEIINSLNRCSENIKEIIKHIGYNLNIKPKIPEHLFDEI